MFKIKKINRVLRLMFLFLPFMKEEGKAAKKFNKEKKIPSELVIKLYDAITINIMRSYLK